MEGIWLSIRGWVWAVLLLERHFWEALLLTSARGKWGPGCKAGVGTEATANQLFRGQPLLF